MAVKINFNPSAAQTHTALLRNERAMQKSLLRLSTGMRIINASDDSAGMFIADMLSTMAKAYEQGNRNIQTGISALQIAEASAGQIFDKLQEIYVRAQNSANDINDPLARQALQQEIRNFVDAIQKIGTDTEYNGIRLLDGTFKDKYIHYGPRMEQTVFLSISDLRAQSLGAHMIFLPGAQSSAAGDITELEDFVSNSEKTVTVGGRVFTATQKIDKDIHIYDAGLVAETINRDLSDIGFVAKAVNVSVGAKYTAIANQSGKADLTFYVGNVKFDIKDVDTTISLDELVEKINRHARTVGADLTASVDDGRLVLTSSRGYTIGVQVKLTKINSATTATVNLDQLIQGVKSVNVEVNQSASAIKVGRLYIANDRNFAVDGFEKATFGEAKIGENTGSQFHNLYSINVTTNEGAEVAMLTAQIALRTVDSVRAQIGATMNNLQSIFDAQKVAFDNTKEAESVIRNTDYAKEMSEFTTYQIRMQATIAMLAQANTLPQLVLQLMR